MLPLTTPGVSIPYTRSLERGCSGSTPTPKRQPKNRAGLPANSPLTLHWRTSRLAACWVSLPPASTRSWSMSTWENPAGLLSAFSPRALYQTPRGGVHAYYQHDGAPVRQHRWVAPVFRTSGDLRHGSGGYVVLWQPERLIDDLRRARRSVKFAEVRQALVVSPPAPQGRQATPKSPPDGTEPTPDDLAPSPARSRHAWVKARLIAARVDGRTGPELRQYARQLHAGLVQPPDPRVPHFFPLAEALAVAQWVAGRDWSPERQRLRGLRSGQRRRDLNAERDAQIIALLETGLSIRQVAAELGIPRSTVGRIKKPHEGH